MIYDDVYVRKVLPFLKDDYFHDLLDRKIFGSIKTHVEKYNNNPSVETLSIVFSEANDLSEDQLDSINGILSGSCNYEKKIFRIEKQIAF